MVIHKNNNGICAAEEIKCKSSKPNRKITETGADPGFQVRRGGGVVVLRIMAKHFGVFRVKNHDLTQKNLIFFQF